MKKAQTTIATIGGTVEKAEDWHTHIIDHVPRTLQSLDGSKWVLTEDAVKEEQKDITGTVPIKVPWSQKSIDNPAPTRNIVVSFKL